MRLLWKLGRMRHCALWLQRRDWDVLAVFFIMAIAAAAAPWRFPALD